MFAYQDDDEYVGALVGHSYIRRFRAALGYAEDVDTIPEARQLATLLRVEQKFTQIYTNSKVRDDHPGAPAGSMLDLVSVHHLPDHDTLRTFNTDYVVTDVASNDLSRCTGRNPQKVVNLATDLWNWADNLNIPVVIQAVLPRYDHILCSWQDFAWNQQAFNAIIRERVDASPNSLVSYNKMQGCGEPYFPQLMHTDRIHVADPLGKYKQRIRNSLLGYHKW